MASDKKGDDLGALEGAGWVAFAAAIAAIHPIVSGIILARNIPFLGRAFNLLKGKMKGMVQKIYQGLEHICDCIGVDEAPPKKEAPKKETPKKQEAPNKDVLAYYRRLSQATNKKELQKTFHIIMKEVHPDTNPNVDPSLAAHITQIYQQMQKRLANQLGLALVRIANRLDASGLKSEADVVDRIVQEAFFGKMKEKINGIIEKLQTMGPKLATAMEKFLDEYDDCEKLKQKVSPGMKKKIKEVRDAFKTLAA